jgi:hypothetical protein
MKEFLNKLLGLLLQMNLKPQSGFGKTEIIWENGQIAYISNTETTKIK